jgi:hypothetical protein
VRERCGADCSHGIHPGTLLLCAVESDGSITLGGLGSSPSSLVRLLCVGAEDAKRKKVGDEG